MSTVTPLPADLAPHIPGGPARFAFLGPHGTFTEQAAYQVIRPQDELVPYSGVPLALAAVRHQETEYAVVPIENSIEGGVSATLDALASGKPLVIVAEMLVPITFVLAVRPGVGLETIQRVSTHPHAWAQCHHWIASNLGDATHVPATSTAAAAKLLSEQRDAGFDAALCNALSAAAYNLEIAAEQVADNPDAVTRFVMVAQPGTIPQPTGADKTTLMVQLPDNESGELLTMLEQFSARGVNLSRIESRPAGDTMGRYAFSIDVEGHISEERVQAALIGLHRTCPLVRFLGSYPRADRVRPRVLPGTSDTDFGRARTWIGQVLAGESC